MVEYRIECEIMKLLKNPKFIYFDLRNVLLHEVGKTDLKIAQNLNIGVLEFARIQRSIYQQLYQKGYHKFLQRKTINEEICFYEQFFREMCLLLQIPFSKERIDILVTTKLQGTYELEPGALALLQALFTRYPLGIISNGSAARRKYELKTNNIDKYFQIIILSFEVGFEKPDPRIFQLAATSAKVDPKDILFIDDRLRFLEGAVQAGIENVVQVTTLTDGRAHV